MERVRYVGRATSSHATVNIHLCMFSKKKKKRSSHFAIVTTNIFLGHGLASQVSLTRSTSKIRGIFQMTINK